MIKTESINNSSNYIETILDYINLNPDILVFGVDIEEAQKNNELSVIYSNRELEYTTNTIHIEGHFLDAYGGSIGVRYYA